MLSFLLLLLLPYVLQPASVRAFSNRSDVNSLLAFKSSLRNQHGVLATWNTTTDFCQWPGVGCSIKHKQRVTVLNLSFEGLGGTIAPSIGNLSFLRILDLSQNNLQGEIPSSIGHLSRLRYLDLSNNSLHGEVNAGLKNCTSLERINIGTNGLTGKIPAWLGDLSSLTGIDLAENNFTGIIPSSLTNLSAMQIINFFRNQLEGAIPEGLGRLGSLAAIILDGNHLTGTIPTALFNLSSLIQFSVVENELGGKLPPDFGDHLPNLKSLLFGGNHFTGNLPASLVNSTEIFQLDVAFNNFTGRLPPEIGMLCPDYLSLGVNQFMATTMQDWEFMTLLTNCTRLRVLNLQFNMLGGVLPSSVANLSTQLQVLYVGVNEISGKIPFGIGNLVGLNRLQLARNRFSGALPDTIGRLNSLQSLQLYSNLLTGFMPSSLGNLTQLLTLYTDHNMFEGPLPASLGNLREITRANFANNKFTGPLPKEIFNLSSLSDVLDLSSNYFVGPLPPEVGGLTNLARLYLSQNNLSGALPNALSNCQSLTELGLDGNSFDSSIPSSISKMRGLMLLNLTKNTLSGVLPQDLGLMGGLQELYLACNNLSGHIPESLENVESLYQLDLSFNHLDGKVPSRGVFINASGFSFGGNLGLCGGLPELHLPPCQPESVGHGFSKRHLTIILVTTIAGIILALSLMLAFFTMRKKSKARSTTTGGFQLMDVSYPRVTYAELVQGTSGFAVDNLIGRGRYGSVYKCCLLLKNMMTTVAIKVFDLQQSGSSRSFLAECEALGKIRHRNLISLITCCSSSDSNQNDFKAIVFEFMPNGSLDRWLHMDVHVSHQLQGLTLMQRLNIAVDIADAIDYLHNNCEPPIIHCDLKPSNILLNEDLVAQVGDFGLAKILSEPAADQLINSKSTVRIRGTIGYVAPEYGEGGQVSSCGDVYSFGTVMLELFTGMRPTHDMFRDGLTLQKHAENAFPGMLMQIADPVLLSAEEANDNSLQDGSNTVEHAIFSVMKVALSCSKHAPTERMCIRDAAAAIHRIRDGYVKARQNEGVATAAFTARHFAETSRAAP
ncbi:probable LRR receptor-like serine/threonine-protein kinase At3g47570 [Triticum urartu]|uniref:Receptor kinase-like protein Xa21 n=1 Tax=Triticum urartu TaxID=4572 RepID=A0A8R7UW77_TRIUA|nr:probable LRR receptor-like serine/threonine-protein kinase At3g47570 [Triticum urartu]XP_048536781.1 probable LRR receptor-like serine/threonine-protein kinase At3g47570 [Triticum urartu]